MTIFISACSHANNGQKQQPLASNLTPINNAQLAGPKSSCEQINQPIQFVDQTAYKQISVQLQQWADNQQLKSGKRFTASLIQLPAKPGDRLRARLFIDGIAIWPTTLLMETTSGQLAAADPVLMKNLITAEFKPFQSDESDVIEHAGKALAHSGKWIDSCRVYDIGRNAASVETSWLVNFKQGFGGTSVEINDRSMQVIRSWPLAQD